MTRWVSKLFFFFFVSLKGRDISQSCTEVMKGKISCNQYVFSDGGITNLNLQEFLFLERLWLMYVASDVWSFFDWCMWLIFTHTEGTLGKIHPNKRDTERYCFLLDGLLICCKQVIFYHYIFYRVFFFVNLTLLTGLPFDKISHWPMNSLKKWSTD